LIKIKDIIPTNSQKIYIIIKLIEILNINITKIKANRRRLNFFLDTSYEKYILLYLIITILIRVSIKSILRDKKSNKKKSDKKITLS